MVFKPDSLLSDPQWNYLTKFDSVLTLISGPTPKNGALVLPWHLHPETLGRVTREADAIVYADFGLDSEGLLAPAIPPNLAYNRRVVLIQVAWPLFPTWRQICRLIQKPDAIDYELHGSAEGLTQ